MPENPHIEELRRRVQKDPASIAFAQLAEEYRRAGHFEDAIKTCRAGLANHPGYLSARVTLGRSLIEKDDLDTADVELRYVLRVAPENLAAIRGVAEIFHRRGNLAEALKCYRSALALAPHDPDLEQMVEDISRTLEPSRGPADVPGGMSFEQASAEFLFASSQEPATPLSPPQTVVPAVGPAPVETVAPAAPPLLEPVAPAAPTLLETVAPAAPPLPEPVAPAAPTLLETVVPAAPPLLEPVATPTPHPDLHALPELERFLDAIVAYRQRTAD